METETSRSPILEIAWTRHANLDSAATRRTKAFYNIRKWIIVLGVIATFLAIVTEIFFSNSDPTYSPYTGYKILSLIFKLLLIATPVLASIFAAFSTRFYSN